MDLWARPCWLAWSPRWRCSPFQQFSRLALLDRDFTGVECQMHAQNRLRELARKPRAILTSPPGAPVTPGGTLSRRVGWCTDSSSRARAGIRADVADTFPRAGPGSILVSGLTRVRPSSGVPNSPADTRLIPDSRVREGTRGNHRGSRVDDCITSGDMEVRADTVGDEAGKAVNRKVHGSSPCSGANSEFGCDNGAACYVRCSLSTDTIPPHD